MGGEATLYLTSGADASSLTRTARNAIQQAMNNGDMDNVVPRVVRVIYRTSDVAEATKLNTPNDGGGGSSSIPFYTWIFIAAGVIIFALVGYKFARRRRKQRNTNADCSSGSNLSKYPEHAHLQDPPSLLSSASYDTPKKGVALI